MNLARPMEGLMPRQMATHLARLMVRHLARLMDGMNAQQMATHLAHPMVAPTARPMVRRHLDKKD
jgi:hypothetical protein